LPILLSSLRPAINVTFDHLSKLQMYLLSFESDLNRLRAINDIILVCRD
jgi:hypothetical protein